MMSNLKRQYLNSVEKNFYMITKAFIQNIEGIRSMEGKTTGPVWEEWAKRGMITKDMTSNLKKARTYLKKFITELEFNLSEEENARLDKYLKKFDYRLVDDYTVQRILRQPNDKNIVINRDCIIDCMEDIAGVRCVGCTSDYRNCEIARLLQDMGVAFLGEEENCPFAANLSSLNEENIKKVDELKKKINKNNQVGKQY